MRENVMEILGIVSSELPAMIKSILSAVFSEETGRNMGKAAVAYYKELKDGGLPEQLVMKMTEEYARTFTSLGYMFRSARRGRWSHYEGGDTGRQIEENTSKGFQRKEEEEK